MKIIRPKEIQVYRFDIEHSLKQLPKGSKMFPYILKWNAIGKDVKKVDIVCDKDKAIYVDIQYYDRTTKIKLV